LKAADGLEIGLPGQLLPNVASGPHAELYEASRVQFPHRTNGHDRMFPAWAFMQSAQEPLHSRAGMFDDSIQTVLESAARVLTRELRKERGQLLGKGLPCLGVKLGIRREPVRLVEQFTSNLALYTPRSS